MIQTVDVAQVIDGQKVGALQVRAFLLCAAVLFVDGFDVQGITYVATTISAAWSLPRGALGPTFSAGLFGVMLGAILLAPLADRIGRRRVIIWSCIAFGLCTLLTVFVGSLSSLLVLRFLHGPRARRRAAERDRARVGVRAAETARIDRDVRSERHFARRPSARDCRGTTHLDARVAGAVRRRRRAAPAARRSAMALAAGIDPVRRADSSRPSGSETSAAPDQAATSGPTPTFAFSRATPRAVKPRWRTSSRINAAARRFCSGSRSS